MRTIVMALACFLGLVSCGSGPQELVRALVASIHVVPSSTTIARGGSMQLGTDMRDANGAVVQGRTVSWSSLDPSIATVTPTGVLTGVSNGRATIRASVDGVSADAIADVMTTAIARVNVTPQTPLALVGGTAQFSAETIDGSGTTVSGHTCTWSSSNTSVATISSTTGMANAVAAGTATIQANCEGIASSTALTVIDAPVAGAVPLIFASDFSTALGNSANAVSDGAKPIHWNDIHPDADQLYVVSANGLGFPSGITNVLRTRYMGVNSADVKTLNQWAEPTTGQSLYFRMYYRLDIPNSYGNLPSGGHHPIEPQPGACPFQWEIRIGSNTNGTMDFKVTLPTGDYNLRLNKFQTYRYEWAFKNRTSTGSYKFEIRVFDSNGNVVGWNGTFIRMNTTVSLAADDPTFPLGSDCIRSLTVGSNGPSGWESVGTSAADAFSYHSGVAVSRTGWIGPYVPGEHP